MNTNWNTKAGDRSEQRDHWHRAVVQYEEGRLDTEKASQTNRKAVALVKPSLSTLCERNLETDVNVVSYSGL